MVSLRKKQRPERAPGIWVGVSKNDGEVLGSKENCGSTEENSDKGGEKATEVEEKEDEIEGKEKKSGDLEGVALKKPNKRGRKKQATVSSKRCRKEIGEEGNVEGKSSDFVTDKDEEGGERKMGFNRKCGRKGKQKEVVHSEGQEDGYNENGDNGIPAKRRGRRGRPKKQVSESEGNGGKDVKEGGAEEQGSYLGVDAGKKMDKEVVGNGKSSENEEGEFWERTLSQNIRLVSQEFPRKMKRLCQI
ncbi:hypothetical protein REPUB_Repub04eG0117400 [Reevesia pubescens]